jgi:hypothetical protein
MNRERVSEELAHDMEAPGRTPAPSHYDWVLPAPWRCPRCLFVIVTPDASPRCSLCGFHEGLE